MRKELTALRKAMTAAGVDIYVIPTDDFHGSEYVGDYFRCRAHVSGFTGSAARWWPRRIGQGSGQMGGIFYRLPSSWKTPALTFAKWARLVCQPYLNG